MQHLTPILKKVIGRLLGLQLITTNLIFFIPFYLNHLWLCIFCFQWQKVIGFCPLPVAYGNPGSGKTAAGNAAIACTGCYPNHFFNLFTDSFIPLECRLTIQLTQQRMVKLQNALSVMARVETAGAFPPPSAAQSVQLMTMC